MSKSPDEGQLAEQALHLEHFLDRLRADLTTTLRSRPITGARYEPVGGIDARPKASSAAGRLVGWSIATAGAAAVVRFRDGGDTTAPLIAVVTLPANSSQTKWAGPAGVSFVDGLFVEVVGTVEGAVWIGAVD